MTAGALSLTAPTHPAALSRKISSSTQQEMLLYVGTYTSKGSKGIYVYRMNLLTGELKHLSTVEGIINPSFLTIDAGRRYLYAVNEVEDYAGKSSGAVSAFAIDKRTGNLKFLNQQSSQGGAPCYITLDRTGRFALVANYGGGSVSVLPVQADGSLGAASDVVQHKGASINPKRQASPHAHCVVLDDAGRYAYVADLGLDKVMIYRFDARQGKLVPNTQSSAATKPGAGPRHFTFHPSGRYAYVINELDSTLTAYSFDKKIGTLKEVQTVSTLPANFSGVNYCADVHVAPSGRFIYGSNRGHDSIVAFAIDKAIGRLNYVGHESTGGKTPRNFAIDPTGRWLLAANQNSDTIAVFRIDERAGKLTPTNRLTESPTPVCLKLIQA